MSELLPCPFCGVQPETRRVDDSYGNLHSIYCSNEDCSIGCTVANGDPAEAIAAWNTRTALPQGEPVAWVFETFSGRVNTPDEDWITQFSVQKPFDAVYRRNIRPLYTRPSLPVSEPGVREALVRAKADLEASRTLAREVLGEPHGINQTLQMIEAALSTSPSNGEVKP